MDENTPGREPVQIVELRQPRCARTFGTAPCLATGTADEKCYNTRATCRYTAAYLAGTPLSLFFSTGAVAARQVSGASVIHPALVSVSTAPTRINLAGADDGAAGLGTRAVCSVVIADFGDSDRITDPYLAGRSWAPLNPFAANRGTFWSRWLARNPYRQNVEIRVYDGYRGQALSAMVRRTYFMQSAQLAGGRMTITGKDILARIEDRKAQAPLASPGYLRKNISASATSITVGGAVEADYPASGTLRIGTEVMTYASRAASGADLVFSGVVRGTDGTGAATHSADDVAQLCLRFAAEPVADALQSLLTDYGGIDASWLDSWTAEADAYLGFYDLTGLVTEPTSVTELVSEIQLQTLCYLWWDERSAKVKLKAVRGIDADPPLLTGESHILAGTFEISEEPAERASQAWVYWGQIDPTKAVDDQANFRAVSIFADLGSEGADRYGEPSIRKIFARFLVSAAPADNTASKVLTRHVETPHRAVWRMDAKDRGYWTGDTVKVSHAQDVDAFGARRVRQWLIVSAEEVVPGEVVEYTAVDTTLGGRIHYVMAAGAADYPGAATAPWKNAWIGNASGLLSDGTTCARIN